MAGIGFILRKLAGRDDLTGIVAGYLFSAIISSGPWLFTIFSLGALVPIVSQFISSEDLAGFRLIIIYNFSFSLVLTGPLFMVATRFLADRIFLKESDKAIGLLLGGLLTVFIICTPFAWWLYFSFSEMSLDIRFAAFVNFMVISAIWFVSIFLSALKAYVSISGAFAGGLLLSFVAALALAPQFSLAGLFWGFSLGLAAILFFLVARIFSEFPHDIKKPFEFFGYFKKYWDLALNGLIFNLAAWVDKWVMWSAPEAEQGSFGLISYPNYDSAMFVAYLSIIPSMAFFVFNVETRFFEKYLLYYRDIQKHATFDRIQQNHNSLLKAILDGARNLTVLQGIITFTIIMVAPSILELLGVNLLQLGIFRFGALGVFFQVMILYLLIFLTYFDARRYVLSINIFFLISNFLFSWYFLNKGFPYYGQGYAMAAALTFGVTVVVSFSYFKRLPYMTFIAHNASVS
ncbi:MAG: exopolysaccharide Pel transporter PelG [Magnetococcales bacterium]|nr:exopolysaccharide Pel transporter PelG [Magnetococcales bacterium]